MKFAAACNKLLRLSDETLSAFAAQIKALTQKDKEELHAMMVKEGYDVDPPHSDATPA
jgi:hypothetical protein